MHALSESCPDACAEEWHWPSRYNRADCHTFRISYINNNQELPEQPGTQKYVAHRVYTHLILTSSRFASLYFPGVQPPRPESKTHTRPACLPASQSRSSNQQLPIRHIHFPRSCFAFHHGIRSEANIWQYSSFVRDLSFTHTHKTKIKEPELPRIRRLLCCLSSYISTPQRI